MVTLGTTQISNVGGWGSNTVITKTHRRASERTRTTTAKPEQYHDPKNNDDFLVVVSIGRAENVFHPSDSIVKPLRDKGFDPKNLPTEANKAIQIEHKGTNFRFHKRPNPVIDLHKAEPHKALANRILNTLIRTINKISTDGSYKFDLQEPVILNFSRKIDRDGNDLFKISYPGIGGETIHEIETNFGNEVFYPGGELEGESQLDGWLRTSSNQIAKSLFA
jgi:hypothetical protein